MAQLVNRVLVTALVLSGVVVKEAESQQCTNASGCFGCGGSAITCSAAGLTSFPVISVAHQQLAETLDLSENALSSLSFNDLENYSSLRYLDVSSNEIQLIEPGTFSQAVQLQEMDFEGNNLQEIPDNLCANTSNLMQLNFRFNNIENITSATFAGLPLSAEIDLTGNPLNCDCGLRWLPDFINSSQYTGELIGSCSSPPNLSGIDINNLTKSQLTCDYITACGNGTCDLSLGQCTCYDGYTGEDCSLLESMHAVSPKYCPIVDLSVWTTKPTEPILVGRECFPECGNNSSCDLSSGSCNCDPGYSGENCTQVCPPGAFGLNCNTSCTCEAGSCHHITGLCTCFPDYYGVNCSHNCTGAPDCAAHGREPCSLSTPEQTCGICHGGSEEEWGNTPCVSSTSQLQYTMTSSILMYPQSETIAIPQSSPSPTDDKSADSLPLTKTETIAILSVLVVIICLLFMMLFVMLMWKHAFRCQGQKVKPTTSEEKLQGSSDAK